MTTKEEPLPGPAGLEQAIKRHIAERTLGRIQGLEVEVNGDRVIIRGRTASFHFKQQVIQAVIAATQSCVVTRLHLDVDIAVGPP
jgi:hypothetical protein